MFEAFQAQPQPNQHNNWGYEKTCYTERLVSHFLTILQKLSTSIYVLVARLAPGQVLCLAVTPL
jgi:hypothetical protein